MPNLSKSKIIAYRQCPKRGWLEIHRPELRDDFGPQAIFKIDHEVDGTAQNMCDQAGKGTAIDIEELGLKEAFAKSAELLCKGEGPIFEVGHKAGGALAFAEVMLPRASRFSLSWDMVEVIPCVIEVAGSLRSGAFDFALSTSILRFI